MEKNAERVLSAGVGANDAEDLLFQIAEALLVGDALVLDDPVDDETDDQKEQNERDIVEDHRASSPGNTVFQSSFMLTTVQPRFLAASSALSSLPK